MNEIFSNSLLFRTYILLSINIEMYRTVILPVVLCGCETWSLTNVLYRTFRSV